MVLVFVAFAMRRQWVEYRAQPLDVQPVWGGIVLASAIWLGAFVVLIQTWRAMLATWGERLSAGTAARIWFVSGLARNLPGRVWAIGAMALMSRDANISPAAATGGALLNVAVNIGTGLILTVILGWRHLGAGAGPYIVAGAVTFAVALGVLLLLPHVAPRAWPLLERLARRPIVLPAFRMRAVVISVAGNTIAWVLYGLAFQIFAASVVAVESGALQGYLASWAGSYVLGYLILLVPAGLGVRELSLQEMLTSYGLANPRQAVVISLTSRVWLTALEILPGLVFLALRPRRHESSSPAHAGDDTSG